MQKTTKVLLASILFTLTLCVLYINATASSAKKVAIKKHVIRYDISDKKLVNLLKRKLGKNWLKKISSVEKCLMNRKVYDTFNNNPIEKCKRRVTQKPKTVKTGKKIVRKRIIEKKQIKCCKNKSIKRRYKKRGEFSDKKLIRILKKNLGKKWLKKLRAADKCLKVTQQLKKRAIIKFCDKKKLFEKNHLKKCDLQKIVKFIYNQ
ncbi:hypothetical protein ABK040_004573 [Willaertia magna]